MSQRKPRPRDTPSMAKNKIRRSLLAIIDPHPSPAEVDDLWGYFESKCAYCGAVIPRESRTGHLDHVLASAAGGSNSIHNFVLSCARCNGDDKREGDWRAFLSRTAEPTVVTARATRIEAWLSRAPATGRRPELAMQANKIVEEAISDFDRAVARMRALVKRVEDTRAGEPSDDA